MVTEIERLWHVLRDLPHFLWPFEPKKESTHTRAMAMCKSVCVSMYIWGQERVSLDSIRHETAQRYWKDIDYATIVGKCCLSGHVTRICKLTMPQ